MAKKLNVKGIELPLLKETDTTTYPRLTVKRDGITYNTKTAKADSTNKKAGTECFKFGDYEWLIKNSWCKLLPADCTYYMKNNYASTYKTITVLPDELQDVDTSNVTNMCFMFFDCLAITSIPQLDTSKVTNMYGMFSTCNAIKSIPQLDTSKVTDMRYMFSGCMTITSIPQLDTSKVTNMDSMFNGCRALTSIPQLDTSKVTNTGYMFDGCNAIKSIPQLDTSKVINMIYMFCDCNVLTHIPQLDTSNVTDMRYMFKNCTSLPEEFPWAIDCSSITTINSSVVETLDLDGVKTSVTHGIKDIFTNSSVREVHFKNVKAGLVSSFTAANLGSKLTNIVIENTI